jgi:hypothetical protein
MRGRIVKVISIVNTRRKPLVQPNLLYVAPIMSDPIAEPILPVPSMIPVTVEVAFSLFFNACYLPRSAAHDPESILASPLTKNPKENIKA